MRKLFTTGAVATLIVGFATLSACSSGGTSESGLGLDVSGQWRGSLVERRSGRAAGNISFSFQSSAGSATLNPLTSGDQTVNGSVAFENLLSDDCPIRSLVGTINGTVVGNDVVIGGEESNDFTITLAGVVTNARIEGDWNMHFEFEQTVVTIDEEGNEEEETIDVACNNFGTWTAVKTNS